jgi:phage terminase large subunit-like protein
VAQDGRGSEKVGQVVSDAGSSSGKDRKSSRKASHYSQYSSPPGKGGDERQEGVGDSGGGGLSRSERNIAWIEKHCVIPSGDSLEFPVGSPVVLTEEQKRWIRLIYDTPTRRFILSMGRKNAKTALSAFLLLLHLRGPEARTNAQLFSAAQSRDQAAVLFDLAAKCVRLSPTLRKTVIPRDTAKQLYCPAKGTLYRALSAEASTAYGLSPAFVVHDELGQVKGPRSELYEALETAAGAQREPLSIIISTQAPTAADLLSTLIDDGLGRKDSRTKVVLYTADEDIDPFSDEAIRQANPHFDVFMNQEEVREQAEAARRMPSREASYRNLILNQRVDAHSPFVSPSVWKENAGSPEADFSGQEIYGGLDLSATADLTACVWVKPGVVWSVKSEFWLPEQGLVEKSKADRVPYDLWKKQGFLNTTPGASISYEFVAHYLRQVFNTCKVKKLAFDRYNMRFLKPWLEKVGFTPQELERFVEFGQGYKDMSPAVRELETLLLARKLAHGGHPVLQMCAANTVVVKDPAENRKFDKAKATGRIDGMVALAMAVAVASDGQSEPKYQLFSL